MKSNEAGFLTAALIARKYALSTGLKPGQQVGPIVLIAGVAKALGATAAASAFEMSGFHNSRAFIESIPTAGQDDASSLPALVPNKQLTALLKGDLASLPKDEMTLMSALEVLLAPRNLTDEVRSALGAFTSSGASTTGDQILFDTRQLVRGLAKVYQRRYLLGHCYVEKIGKSGCSDFVSGGSDDAFSKAYREMLEEQRQMWSNTLGSEAYSHSPLGRIQSDFGENSAHIVAALLLNEMGFVGDGVLSVRELAFITNPKYYHRVVHQVRRDVVQLAGARLVRIHPDEGEVHLISQVLAMPDVVDDFLCFIDRNAAIELDETEELINVIISKTETNTGIA